MKRLMIMFMQGLIMMFDYAKINKGISDRDVVMVKVIMRTMIWLWKGIMQGLEMIIG